MNSKFFILHLATPRAAFDHEAENEIITGPLLPESLDVRGISFSQARQLSIALTVAGGDKWKIVAEKLGLNQEEIRFLDERNTNPVKALLGFIADNRYLSVGDLYQVLCDCGIPVIADIL